MLENLNIAGGVWESIKQWLQAKHPGLFQEYEKIYFSKNNYWDKVEKEIEQFCQQEKVDCKSYFHHGKF
jgi:regulator of sigma D